MSNQCVIFLRYKVPEFRYVLSHNMQPPVDYPITENGSQLEQSQAETYANILYRHANDDTITVQMLRNAERNLAAADQIPSAIKPTIISLESDSGDLLDRIKQVIS